MLKKLRNTYHNAHERAHHHTFIVVVGLLLFASAFAWQILMPQGQASANYDPNFCNNMTDIPQSECEALVALYVSTDGDNWHNKNNRFVTTNVCDWYGVQCEYNIYSCIDWEEDIQCRDNGYDDCYIDENEEEICEGVEDEYCEDYGWCAEEVGSDPYVEYLYLQNNNLNGSINLDGLPYLYEVSISNNQITDINLSNLNNLWGLYIDNNLLTTLDISAHPRSYGYIHFQNNNIHTLIVNNYTNYYNNDTYTQCLADDRDEDLEDYICTEEEEVTDQLQIYAHNNCLSPSNQNVLDFLNTYDYHTSSWSLSQNNCIEDEPQLPEWDNDIQTRCSTFEDFINIPLPECEALVALYVATNGDNWHNKNNRFDTPNICSNWHGIYCNNGTITQISLWGNNLQGSLPAQIGQLTSLQFLDLGANQLTSLPDEIGQLTSLYTLYIGSNQLTSLPIEIGQLTSLNYLDLGGNQLTSLPSEITQLTSLQGLYLYSNQLTSLPSEIVQLTSLKQLYLWGNQLTSLPIEIGQLTSLNYLDLGSNQLTSLPAQIGQLTGLNYLDLGSNQLTSLPSEIVQLNMLQQLEVGNNCLDIDSLSNTIITYINNIYGGSTRQANQNGCHILSINLQSQNGWLANLGQQDDTLWSSTVYLNIGEQLSFVFLYPQNSRTYNLQGISFGTLFESYLGPTMAIVMQEGWYHVTVDTTDLSYTIAYDPNYDDGYGYGGDGDDNEDDNDQNTIQKVTSQSIVQVGGVFDYTVTVPYLDFSKDLGQDREPWYVVRDYLPADMTMISGQLMISGGNFSGYIDQHYDLYGLRYGTVGDVCHQEFVQYATGPYMDALDGFAQIVSQFLTIEELLAAFFDYDGSREDVPAFMEDYCLSEGTSDIVQCYESFYAQVDMIFLISEYSDSCGEYGLIQEDILRYSTEDKIYGVEGDVCYEDFIEENTGVYKDILDVFVADFIKTFPEQLGQDIIDIYEDLEDIAQEEDDSEDLQELLALLDDLIDSQGQLLDDAVFTQDLLDAVQVVLDRRSMDPMFSDDVDILQELQGLISFLANIDDIQTPEQLFAILAGYDDNEPFAQRFTEDFCGEAFGGTDIASCLDLLSYVVRGNLHVAWQYPSCGLSIPAQSPYREMLVPASVWEGQSLIWNYTVALSEQAQVGDTLTNLAQVKTLGRVSESDTADVVVVGIPSTVQAELAQAIYVVFSQDDINTNRSAYDGFIIGEQVRIDDGRGDGGLSGSAVLVDIIPVDFGFEQDSYILVLEDLTLPISISRVFIIGQDSEVSVANSPYIVNSLVVGDEFFQVQPQGENDAIITAFGIIDDKQDDIYTISTYVGQLEVHKLLFKNSDEDDDTDGSDVDNVAFVLSIQQPIDDGDDQIPVGPPNPPGPPPLFTDIEKGICEIRDCSDSYYDQECGICDDEQEHGSADEEEQQQAKSLLIDDMLLFVQTVQQVMAQASCDMSDELVQAYVFAYDVGITTVPDICLADMYGGLIRQHMAKFMVMFATQILGQTPDIQRECLFADMEGETLEFRGFARMACQLGIIGVSSDGTPVDTFNPHELVNRAQFGTALSRMLYGPIHNTTSGLRYQGHLNALQQAGIMNMISNPNMLEVRGRVMLMLMRAYLGL